MTGPQSPRTGTRESFLQLTSDRLLLVEGQDEVNVFSALLGSLPDGGVGSRIQVIEVGGKNGFYRRLNAIWGLMKSDHTLRAIGVVRDADENADRAFQSVTHDLRNAGFEPPDAHGCFSVGTPVAGVFIVPDGRNSGALETLLRRSVEETPAGRCVDQYLDCLEQHDAMKSRNVDKSFAHAFLAASRNPVARVGEGARQGVWDFEHAALADLVRFVRALAERGG